MDKAVDFRTTYTGRLDSLLRATSQSIEDKRASGAYDEAILERIRIGILKTCLQVFHVSYTIVYDPESIKRPIPEWDKVKAKYAEQPLQLFHVYQEFLTMISQSWSTRRTEAESHDDTEATVKEDIKLTTKDEVHRIFKDIHAGFFGDIGTKEAE